MDAGRGANFVRVVDLSTGLVRQTLPLPGGYVGIAFAPDGRRAYVSGQPSDGQAAPGSKGTGGDVIHVYSVNPLTGAAAELEPIQIPNARDGAAAQDELPQASNVNAWPEGMDVTPGGKHLVVALGQADQVAIVNLATRNIVLANVGRYPYGVVADPRRPRAYVTNERDGTVSVIEVPSGRLLRTIPVGGPRGSDYAHPQGIAADPLRDRVYVAVTDRDLVAVLDTNALSVARYLDVSRGGTLGNGPRVTGGRARRRHPLRGQRRRGRGGRDLADPPAAGLGGQAPPPPQGGDHALDQALPLGSRAGAQGPPRTAAQGSHPGAAPRRGAPPQPHPRAPSPPLPPRRGRALVPGAVRPPAVALRPLRAARPRPPLARPAPRAALPRRAPAGASSRPRAAATAGRSRPPRSA